MNAWIQSAMDDCLNDDTIVELTEPDDGNPTRADIRKALKLAWLDGARQATAFAQEVIAEELS